MRRFHYPLLAWIGILILAPLRAQNIHLSSTQGVVSVTRGEGEQSVTRSVQSTLLTDDRIVTGEKSQAVVQLDAANSLQVGAVTQVRFGEVYPGRYQMILEKGAVAWQIQDPNTAQMEVQTPSVSMRPHQPGVYTVGINRNGETEIVVRNGILEVFAPTGSQWLSAGQKMLARGLPSNPEFQIAGVSRWKRFLGLLSSLQIGAVVSSFSSEYSGQDKPKPRPAVNPVHSGNSRIPPTAPKQPPGAPYHQHAEAAQHIGPASTSAQHSTSSAAPAHAASSPAPAPAPAASHVK